MRRNGTAADQTGSYKSVQCQRRQTRYTAELVGGSFWSTSPLTQQHVWLTRQRLRTGLAPRRRCGSSSGRGIGGARPGCNRRSPAGRLRPFAEASNPEKTNGSHPVALEQGTENQREEKVARQTLKKRQGKLLHTFLSFGFERKSAFVNGAQNIGQRFTHTDNRKGKNRQRSL